jgi:hypothetical protein
LEQVLKQQIDQIRVEHRDRLEREITLEELFEEVKALAKNKCPCPDGITAEFFVIHWKLVGPALHRALLKGIAEGQLHPDFTKGFIVLLCKKGDHTLFANKRPLTMLNIVYKIAAKAYQL